MIYGVFYQEYEHFDTKAMRFTGEKYMDNAIGTDSIYILDGRNRLSTQIADMRERAKQLRKVQPHYAAFKIMRGSISHATAITDLIYLNAA